MLRRIVMGCLSVVALVVVAPRPAEAVTVRDIIELSKAGLGEPVLLALIEVDRSVFAIDTVTLKRLKDAGVSDTVIVAMIRSGRQAPEPASIVAQEPQPLQAPPQEPEPQVVVIDHHDQPAPAPAAYPVVVPVPVYVPVQSRATTARRARETVETTIQTDHGAVRARVPLPANCVKAQPVYWGFDGKLRPGSWEPPPTVVCR